MAKKSDPTVTGGTVGGQYPEGTHPIRPISEQTWNGERFSYSDLPDDEKPDPTSIVQQVDSDPIQDANDDALKVDAKSVQAAQDVDTGKSK
jgi:hypothetical protein